MFLSKRNLKQLMVGLLFGIGTMAHATYDEVSHFGVHGGINYMNANVSGSNSDTGFLAGVLFETPLVAPTVYLQPEINVSRVGAENSIFGAFGTTRFTFIEVPVLVKAKAHLGAAELYAEAGPKVAVLVHTEGPALSGDPGNLEFGAYVGGGVGFAVSENANLSLTGRYSIGFTDLDNSATSWQTRGFQLLAGLTF